LTATPAPVAAAGTTTTNRSRLVPSQYSGQRFKGTMLRSLEEENNKGRSCDRTACYFISHWEKFSTHFSLYWGEHFQTQKKAIIKAILALILFWGVDFYQLPILLVLFANGLVR
jgi:hypothetical protein